MSEQIHTSLNEAPNRIVQFGRIYDALQDGQAVDIAAVGSGNVYLEIDEENLGLEKVTLENLQKGWEAEGEVFTRSCMENGITIDPFRVYKWSKIQNKVYQTLGPPTDQVGQRQIRYMQNGSRLKLSKTKGLAMCSEYATLATYIAHKIGEPAKLVVGAVVSESDQDKWRDAHAFVWSDELNAVFDSVQAQSGNEFPALLTPATPVTLEALESGLDVEATRIGTTFKAHYGLEPGGFGVRSAHATFEHVT